MPRYHEGIVDAEEIRKPNAFKNSKIRSQESRQLCKEELNKVVGAGEAIYGSKDDTQPIPKLRDEMTLEDF